MKNIKRISLLLAIVLVFSLVFSVTAFAQDDVKPIEDNDKVFTFIPWEYELSVFSNNLSYIDEEANSLTFCVGENKFAPDGITALKDWQIETVFEHFYLYDGDLERTDECSVSYKITEKSKVNGYSCYYLAGNYSYDAEDIDTDWAYYFNAYIFATKEDIFVVGYEDINGNIENYEDLMVSVNGIVLNGTHLNGDKPEKNVDHDFSNSPAFNDVITAAQENFMGDIFEDEGMLSMVIVMIVLLTIVPTAVLIIIAIVLIIKYSKNKSKLKRYELTYGSIPQYNAYSQNNNGYGYNQPVNQPYQSPVNPAYQQNPINQNVQQTPSYVTNAVNNLATEQPTQPTQEVPSPEVQENQVNNEN
ncbi:MAG: hypothetical protein UGF89_04990 [Acutalibacteraceae bacterium]|nr:hypothetical protein [Acutalibacteraceae bacterium]